jgi:hypothetical protein
LVDGIPIRIDWTDFNLAWFLCPRCGRRCKHLYFDELACRTCLGLENACRHVHRSVPGIHRIKRLRRRIGVDERPFSPIPRRQRHHLRYNRIADEIRGLELKLAGHLGNINRTLEKRARRCGMLPR